MDSWSPRAVAHGSQGTLVPSTLLHMFNVNPAQDPTAAPTPPTGAVVPEAQVPDPPLWPEILTNPPSMGENSILSAATPVVKVLGGFFGR